MTNLQNDDLIDCWIKLCGNEKLRLVRHFENYELHYGDGLVARLVWTHGSGPVKKQFGSTKCLNVDPYGHLWIMSMGQTSDLTRDQFDTCADRAIYRDNKDRDMRDERNKAIMQELLK